MNRHFRDTDNNGIDNPETLTTMGTPDTGRIQNKNKNNKQTNTQHNRDNFKYEQHGHHKKPGGEQLFLNSKNGQHFSVEKKTTFRKLCCLYF